MSDNQNVPRKLLPECLKEGYAQRQKNHKGVHPFAQLGCEVVEDEVGKDLRHCADAGNVMAHHHIGECEVCCGAVR